jgi:hypothetical protein
MALIGMPGGMEWILIMFIGVFGIGIKLAFMVFVIFFLVKINGSLEALKKKSDQLEQHK